MRSDEKIGKWMTDNPDIFGKIIAVVLLTFGVCLIIGSIKNWDWLYAADGHYQNNWSMGQISRYLGRKMARIIGFVGGIFITTVGSFLLYAAFS